MVIVRRLSLLTVCGLLAVACAGSPAPNTSIPPPETTAPTTTAAPTTSLEAPTTTGEPVEVQRITCSEAGEQTLVCEAFDLIERFYVDPVPVNELATGAAEAVENLDTNPANESLTCHLPADEFELVCTAMSLEGASQTDSNEATLMGMMSALDANSAYLDPAALRLLEQDQSGEVEGIGALVASEDLTAADPASTPCGIISDTCRLVVVSTFKDSPAERAGLLGGDVMVGVNGQDIKGWTIDEVTATVRGPAGTRVTLTIERAGQTLEIVIVRASLTIPVVETAIVGDTGYLRLNLFTDQSDVQVHTALESLLNDGIDQLVLDLRDNPGGALDATVGIASEFLDGGIVVRTEAPESEDTYEVRRGGLATDPTLDVAVIVNRGSASASEVLSGALKEAGRAVVIGENTFGKNTVQQRFDLSNGGALKLTVARWVTAAGTDFGGDGITPDVEAEFESDISPAQLVERVAALAGWSVAA